MFDQDEAGLGLGLGSGCTGRFWVAISSARSLGHIGQDRGEVWAYWAGSGRGMGILGRIRARYGHIGKDQGEVRIRTGYGREAGAGSGS